MIVYSSTKDSFIRDVREDRIEDIINNEVLRKLNRNSGRAEILSWKHSLDYMFRVLVDPEIPPTAGVAIEYNIPLTNRRVDFILTGKDASRRDSAVIIELKQWESAEVTNKDGIVKTLLSGSIRETSHPSYQAWSYAALIEDYNETVRNESIALQPCAYLHNMRSDEAIRDPFYHEHTNRAPAFIAADVSRLTEFLKRFVKYGDSDHILYRIENGAIKPSKTLADSLSSMLKGAREFVLLDEQKVVYETAIDLVHTAKKGIKQTLIVKGGPGTGKSVVAINLLVELTKREMLAQYVSKNSAPRDVFKSVLSGSHKKSRIDNLFKGSGSYIDVERNFFDALIVDEAHRLNEKSGLFSNLGENQIKEIISAAKLSVFFIDEDQRVTFQDIGTIEEIMKHAQGEESYVTILSLESQFRCNGSDGYLAWLDHALQIRETANPDLSDIDYEFRVFENPDEMRAAIIQKNQINNKSRMVAGYCWDWKSKTNPAVYDIIMDEHDFKARWNLASEGSLWLISPSSVNEVGCIHTCQGLELDYVGVIIGPDFIVREGKVFTEATARSRMDKSIRGYKSLHKKAPASARSKADAIIRNTYRTLMTRGMKGCYVYATDKETRDYFASFQVSIAGAFPTNTHISPYADMPFRVLSGDQVEPYQGFVPIFDIAAAAGDFSPLQNVEESDWVELPEEFVCRPGMFVARVVGESMNRRIPNGSWCVFKANPGGTRNGKVVLVQHRRIEDPDHGGCFTVKLYQSEKRLTESGPINEKIILAPDTHAYGYSKIVLHEDDLDDFRVIGELVAVL